MEIVLGSKSPRRKELLEGMGYSFIVDVKDVKEDINEYKTPKEYVKKTAIKKGLETAKYHQDALVICADTIVEHNGDILEKPKNKDDARRMITSLSNDTHHVYTAVFLSYKNKKKVFVEGTKVTVDYMSSEEIEAYIDSNEPYDKAGAYAIQGIFSKYIKKIDGDYYNVMGLPVNKLYQEIKKITK